jgi:hypothetical protein
MAIAKCIPKKRVVALRAAILFLDFDTATALNIIAVFSPYPNQ